MSEDKAGKRLFIGARVSVATANTLAGCAETLARRARDAGVDLRWVAPTNYHVTVAFLGWTRLDAIAALCDAVGAAVAGTPRISFRTTRLGGFPSLDKASVLWAGVDEQGGAALTRLADAVAAATARLGFRRDFPAYHPHVTIARLREARDVRDVVLPMAEQMFGDTKIEAVTLFESETKSSGSVYQDVCKLPFQPARPAAVSAEKRQTAALEQPDDALTQTDDGWPRGQGPTD
ncbi:MAG TPA: RNA 2',3'-cyclic phosphodiesterase [Kofleriaceae bacterium]|nr:RNA 2',3'-cyclic phosphodiesterase [Kofleriaceae bacterium]